MIEDHPVGVSIPVSKEEVHDNIGEEDELHAFEVQQLLRQATEEAKLQGGEEGGVDGPQEHHVHPKLVPSAAKSSNKHDGGVLLNDSGPCRSTTGKAKWSKV